MSRIYDCPPSLDEFGVIDFCKNGFLLFPGVVSEEINERTIEFIETNPGPVDYEPSHILDEDWFVDSVICQPEVAGAVRCLLGRDFGLPILMSSHKVECPQPRSGVAPGRRLKVGAAGELPPGVLLPAGDHGRDGPDGAAARLAPPVFPVHAHGTLWQHHGREVRRVPGGVHRHHGV